MRLFSLLVLLGISPVTSAVPIYFDIGDRSDIFGAGAEFIGTRVAFEGVAGSLDMPLDQFSVFEVPVGTLSITTSSPLSRDLPVGFHIFEFPISLSIDGHTGETATQLLLTVDQSNDGATLLGGRGTTRFDLASNFYMEFQFLTSSTGAANAGQTRNSVVTGQFYGRPVTAVSEPGTLAMLSLGLLLLLGVRSRRYTARCGLIAR